MHKVQAKLVDKTPRLFLSGEDSKNLLHVVHLQVTPFMKGVRTLNPSFLNPKLLFLNPAPQNKRLGLSGKCRIKSCKYLTNP